MSRSLLDILEKRLFPKAQEAVTIFFGDAKREEKEEEKEEGKEKEEEEGEKKKGNDKKDKKLKIVGEDKEVEEEEKPIEGPVAVVDMRKTAHVDRDAILLRLQERNALITKPIQELKPLVLVPDEDDNLVKKPEPAARKKKKISIKR